MRAKLTASLFALALSASAAGAADLALTTSEQQLLNAMSPELRLKVESRITDENRVSEILQTLFLNELINDFHSVRDFRVQQDGYYALVRDTGTSPWYELYINPRTGAYRQGRTHSENYDRGMAPPAETIYVYPDQSGTVAPPATGTRGGNSYNSGGSYNSGSGYRGSTGPSSGSGYNNRASYNDGASYNNRDGYPTGSGTMRR